MYKHICIQGNIGSGKSTILRLIKEMCGNNVEIIHEPVEKWVDNNNTCMLTKFYSNMEKYSPELQEIITNSYIELYNNLTNNIDENKIYLYERSHESSIYVFLKELKKYYINLDEYESNMLKLKN